MISVLLVDDSESSRQSISFILKQRGFNAIEALDGQDGLEKSGTRDFSLVLIDQGMLRLDGIELTRRLRKNPKFATVPIVIMADNTHSSLKQVGLAAGCNFWLPKPFSSERLMEVIAETVR